MANAITSSSRGLPRLRPVIMKRLVRFLFVLAALIGMSVHAQDARPPGAVPPSLPPPDRVVICIDRSGSMGPRAVEDIRRALTQALSTFSGAELPFDVAIMAFGSRVVQLSDFSHSRADVVGALNQFQVEIGGGGGTVLNDVVLGAIARLNSVGGGHKRVLIVSDGVDNGSASSRRQLLNRVGPGIAVDAIVYGARTTTSDNLLALLVGTTNGRYLASDASNLTASFVTMLKGPNASSGAGSAAAPPVSAPATVPSPATVPALHSVKVNVRATSDAKCLQLAYGVAVGSLQEVSATTTLVSGRLGAVNLSINCVALGAGQPAVAVVTAAGGTASTASQAADNIAAKLAAATN